MPKLLDRRILFIGGKGGVGKTTVAATIALIAADRGRRCLLVSTDPAHSLSDIFDKDIGKTTTAIVTGLWGLEIDPDAAADKHIEMVKHNMRYLVRPALYDEIEKQMNLARLAPGMVESAMLERLSELMIESGNTYDLVIFDTAPTGHTLRLLSLPEIMTAWTDGLLKHRQRSDKLAEVLGGFGFRRNKSHGADSPPHPTQNNTQNDERNRRIRIILEQRSRKFRRARRLLLDEAKSAFILVINPEKLPILETQKALTQLRQFKISVEFLIVNRVLPDAVTGEFMEDRKRQEAQHLAEIEQRFRQLRRCCLPLLPQDVYGLKTLDLLRRRLEIAIDPPANIR